MIRFRTYALMLSLVCALTSVAQDKEGGLLIDPATVDFTLLNGQSATTQIKVINKLSTKKQFNLYFNDWQRDSTGKHVYTEPGTEPRSCARWVTIDKTFLEVGPGETQTINVRLAVPDSVELTKQMRWAMLFIESIEEKKAPQKIDGVTTEIVTKFRVGVHIYQTPPTKINKEVRMLTFSAKENSGDSIYRIQCENVGDVQIKCKSYLELASLENGEKITVGPVTFPMFPSQKRNVEFVLPRNLAKGKYTLTGAVDAGEDVPLEAAQTIIEIK